MNRMISWILPFLAAAVIPLQASAEPLRIQVTPETSAIWVKLKSKDLRDNGAPPLKLLYEDGPADYQYRIREQRSFLDELSTRGVSAACKAEVIKAFRPKIDIVLPAFGYSTGVIVIPLLASQTSSPEAVTLDLDDSIQIDEFKLLEEEN